MSEDKHKKPSLKHVRDSINKIYLKKSHKLKKKHKKKNKKDKNKYKNKNKNSKLQPIKKRKITNNKISVSNGHQDSEESNN